MERQVRELAVDAGGTIPLKHEPGDGQTALAQHAAAQLAARAQRDAHVDVLRVVAEHDRSLHASRLDDQRERLVRFATVHRVAARHRGHQAALRIRAAEFSRDVAPVVQECLPHHGASDRRAGGVGDLDAKLARRRDLVVASGSWSPSSASEGAAPSSMPSWPRISTAHHEPGSTGKAACSSASYGSNTGAVFSPVANATMRSGAFCRHASAPVMRIERSRCGGACSSAHGGPGIAPSSTMVR